MVQVITSKEQYNTVIASSKLTVVDFFAEWCGPCKVIAPRVEQFSEKYTDAQFFKVDVDQLSDVSAEAGVRAMPTFILYKNGQKVEEVVGANPSGLQKAIESNL